MAYSNSPPRRRSSLWTVVVNPSGPHQNSRPSFVVQSSQTSFADAWKVRSNRIFGLETLADVAVFPLSARPSLPLSVGSPKGLDVDFRHLEQRFHDLRR